MTLDFHALWTLTGVATLVFATLTTPTWRARTAAALAFAAATAAGAWFGPPPADATGLLVGLAAAAMLLRPRSVGLAPLLAGALGGAWGIMLAAQDVAPALAIPVAALGPAAAMWCARQPAFAPGRLRDDALIVLIVFGAVTAVVPGVLDGWRAAVNLSVQSTPAAPMPLPAWTLAVGGSALALGGLYSLWSRR
jgi:hypothetical protein